MFLPGHKDRGKCDESYYADRTEWHEDGRDDRSEQPHGSKGDACDIVKEGNCKTDFDNIHGCFSESNIF